MLCSTCLSTIWLHQAPLYSIILQFSEDKLCTFPVVHCSLCTELNTFHMLRNQVKNQISHAQSQRKKEGCRSIFDLKKKKKEVVQDNSVCKCWLLALPQSVVGEKQNEEGLSR